MSRNADSEVLQVAREHLTLSEALRLLAEPIEPEEGLKRLAELARRQLGVDRVGLWLQDPGGELRASARAGGNGTHHDGLETVPTPDFLQELVVRGRPVVLPDPAADSSEGESASDPIPAGVSFLGVPVWVDGEAAGVLSLVSRGSRPFAASDVALGEALASSAATLLTRVRHRCEQGQAEVRKLVQLEQAGRVGRDGVAMMQGLCQRVAQLCGADRATILLWNEASQGVVAAASQLAMGEPEGGPWPRLRGGKEIALDQLPYFSDLVLTGRPVLLDDAGRWPRVCGRQTETYGLKSVLAVPLAVGEKVLGGLLLNTTDEVRPFPPTRVWLAMSLADPVALALEGALLDEEREERRRRTEAQFKILRSLNSTLKLKPLLKEITQQAAQACGMDRCSINLWLADRLVPMMSQYADGRVDRKLWKDYKDLQGMRLPDLPFLVEMLRTRQPVIIDHANCDPLWPAAWRRWDTKTVLVVPLIRHQEVIGTLALHHTERETPVTPGQVTLATTIANQVALALDNARLYGETEARLRRTEAILEISRALSSTLELKALLKQTMPQAARACDMEYCAIHLKKEGRFIPAMVQRDHPPADPSRWQAVKGLAATVMEELPCLAEMVHSRAPVVINHPEEDPRWPAELRGFGLKAVLMVPLLRGQEVMGSMTVASGEDQGDVRPEQIAVATGVAGQLALAIDNAHLYQETRKRLGQSREQLKIAGVLGSTLELKPLLKRVTRQAARTCEMDCCTIDLFEEGWVVPTMSQFADGRVDRKLWKAFRGLGRRRVEEVPYFVEMIQTRDAVIIDHPAEDPRWPAAENVFDTKVALAVPLVRHEEVVGALLLTNTRVSDPIKRSQVAVATTIASQIALVIDNARLYEEARRRLRQSEEHLKIARTLSSTLEPGPLLQEIVRQAACACDVDRCSLYLLQEGQLVPVVSQYADGRVRPNQWKAFKGKKTTAAKQRIADLARAGKPLVVYPSQDRFWGRETGAFGTRALMIVPLIQREEVLGAMLLSNTDRLDPLTPEQVALATTIASQVALTLENARLYNEAQRRLGETRALLRVAQTMGSSRSQEEIARRCARQLTKLVGADTTVFYEVDWESGLAVTTAGYRLPHEMLSVHPSVPLDDRGHLILEAVRRGRPLGSNVAHHIRSHHPQLRHLPQPLSLLAAPLMHHGKEQGGLLSFWWTESRDFTAEELGLAEAIARQMALVLEKARNYRQTQEALADLEAAQTRLIETEKFRALAEMAGGVSHDFNNLLTTILHETERLRRHLGRAEIPQELRSSLSALELAARDGAETVRRLLDYTQEKPRSEQSEAVHLNELLAAIKEVSRSRWQTEARSRGVSIVVTLEPAPVPAVRGNPAELREVLLNLVFNAVDAMPNGGCITLSTETEADWVCLRVKDTGVGMSEETRRRIFDPFFTTKGSKSSGLGLSASYGILRRHAGEIAVETQPGHGTTFILRLPPWERRIGT